MKHLIFVVLLMIALPLYAGDTTAELLRSPHVNERAVFQSTGYRRSCRAFLCVAGASRGRRCRGSAPIEAA